uniref:Transmembrane protein n=1 Tax=Pfiesteria piscicida TaxID=71001 RepID=A3E3V8_PFIPI|nr:unknown [Pfiesteria piscicida]
MPCECQWGLSSLFAGIIIIVCAGVFTFFPAFLGLFDNPTYIFLCWFWFLLGCFLTVVGVLFECFGCQKSGRWHNAKARETGDAEAPTPYIMINA